MKRDYNATWISYINGIDVKSTPSIGSNRFIYSKSSALPHKQKYHFRKLYVS